jgi:hypothetical protein
MVVGHTDRRVGLHSLPLAIFLVWDSGEAYRDALTFISKYPWPAAQPTSPFDLIDVGARAGVDVVRRTCSISANGSSGAYSTVWLTSSPGSGSVQPIG